MPFLCSWKQVWRGWGPLRLLVAYCEARHRFSAGRAFKIAALPYPLPRTHGFSDSMPSLHLAFPRRVGELAEAMNLP